MRYLVTSATLLLAVCAGVACAEATKAPQQIVDERVAGMKGMVGNLKGAGEEATPADAKAKFAAAIAFAETIPSLFPKGTGIGDAGVTKTRALQDIWAKPAEFKAGGYHVMLFDLANTVKPGKDVEVTFTLANGDKVSTFAKVEETGAMEGMMDHM